MLAKSDVALEDVIKRFSLWDVDASFLVPTKTGLEKSILDAIGPFRDFLREQGLHDYDSQGQGQANKVELPCFFVGVNALAETTVSLYRPQTKNGDPRVWFRGLKEYCNPHNLLAVVCRDGHLYVINCSNAELLDSFESSGSPLRELIQRINVDTSSILNELMDLLHPIAARGYIKSLREGSTGVGMTLETLLGISANADRGPDYKGVEIKASRVGRGTGSNRVNLFSQVPDWKRSPCQSGTEILDRYGYIAKDGVWRLACTIVADRPNSQGLYFETDTELEWLVNLADRQSGKEEVARWAFRVLQDRLREKHPETIWVKAHSKRRVDGEYFYYNEVHHTRKPKVGHLPYLLQSGVVSMDYTLKRKPSGKSRDHGYLFKIHPKDFDALFPPSIIYTLGP